MAPQPTRTLSMNSHPLGLGSNVLLLAVEWIETLVAEKLASLALF